MTAQQTIFSEPEHCSPRPSPIQFTLITAPSALTAALAAIVQAQVSHNDALPPAPYEDMTVFHALEAPAISVADYVARVSKYVFCSEACLVAAYHYVNTAVRRDPKLALTSLSVHRMFITAVVIACKYFDDLSYNLMYYSKVGGLPHKELANLEINMLRLLDFRLDISAKDFVAIEAEMVSELNCLAASPVDHVVAKLVDRARHELGTADIVPIEFERLSDEEHDDDVVIYHRPSERTHVHGMQAKLRTSPATSTCTEESSKLSRNSSMNSVTEQLSEDADQFVDRSHSNVTLPSKRTFSHSPTTPPRTYRKPTIAVTAAC